jgi:hypothetical protein
MIHPDTSEKQDGLCGLIREKILLFKNFLSLSKSLKEMLEEENMARIRILLRQRQDYINRIDRLDARIRNRKNLDMKAPGQHMEKRLLSLVKELEEITGKTMRVDKDCADLAFSRIEGIRAGLIRIRAGRQGFKGYTGKPLQRPRFLDLST